MRHLQSRNATGRIINNVTLNFSWLCRLPKANWNLETIRKASFRLYFTQGQWSDSVNISHIVLYPISSLLLLLFCSFSILTHHLSHLSIASPYGAMFSQIPLVARSASALTWSPTFAFLVSSLCLVISIFSPPSSLSPRAGGPQLPEQYKSIT